ncbi:restriction endonuclease DdeI [Caloranaerobacter azorensis H53214]|nr:restriction endonuclease DdeI [Caloranaerobacter azorensis H53214]
MIDKGIEDIIRKYNELVKGIDSKAESSISRAYGGVIRAGKGKLVESMARQMVRIAWEYGLDRDISRLEMNAKKIKVPINQKYVNNLKENNVKQYISSNIEKFYYNAGTDVHVYIDNVFVMAIECKAYTENAMLKRILVDAELLKKYANIKKYVLLQLESQLGGDYCELKDIDSTIGSPSTRTLLSYFDVNIDIITLLKGERKVDRPIHRKEFFKELTYDSVKKAILFFIEELREFK